MDFLRKHTVPLLGISIVTLILFLTNYIPGTYLTGWDNLQTSLNPGLAIKRAFFSTWQEYQSFGLLAGLAHGADIVRALSTAFLGLLLPSPLVRYIYHFSMICLGALGMYSLLSASQRQPLSRKKKLIFTVGSLFYILNYGVIQLFSVPFEPFSTFIGFLPWLIWIFLQYLRSARYRRKYLMMLLGINILATPLAYVQTIFVVYALMLGLVSLTTFLTQRNRRATLKRITTAVLLILAINSFWLLPQLYFVTSGGPDHVQQAKINQLATDDVAAQNQEFGTAESFITFEGFYSSLENIDKQSLFAPWRDHFKSLPAKIIQGLFFTLMLYGMLEKSRYRGVFVGLFGLSGLALMTNVPGISFLNDLIRRLPLVSEIFRSPFTKFIVVYALAGSYFFSYGLLRLQKRLRWKLKKDLPLVAYIATLILFIYAFPAFKGHYIARDMRVSIPQDYLDTIEYFQTVDRNQRIALMPDYTFWGWFFHEWGYNGSGFLWYGIEQPIVSRTFDVWEPTSEAYFWEMKTAIEAEDVNAMETVLDKYAIDYIIVDHTLKPVSSSIRALQYDRLNDMLSQSQKTRQFGFGKALSLFTFDRSSRSNSFVSLAHDIPSVGPAVPFIPYDTAYAEFGTYTSSPYTTGTPDIYYPFRSLFSQKRLYDDQWALQEFDEAFVLTARLPENAHEYKLTIPSDSAEAELFINGEKQTYVTNLSFEFDEDAGVIKVIVPKTTVTELLPALGNVFDCGTDGNTDIHTTDTFLRVFSNHGAVPCIEYDIPFLSQEHGYLVSFQNRNIQGRRLFMSITDKTKGQAYIEDRLIQDVEHYMLPPRFATGLGYTVTFQNHSYINLPSTNVIDAITVYHFPYQQIADIRMEHRGNSAEGRLSPIARSIVIDAPQSVKKRQYDAYTVDLDRDELVFNEYLILNQAFHTGWNAYIVSQDPISQYIPFLAGRHLKDHVKINTWSQGWILPETCQKNRTDCRIVLVFWPQYLQYIGFVLLLGAGGYVVFIYRSHL